MKRELRLDEAQWSDCGESAASNWPEFLTALRLQSHISCHLAGLVLIADFNVFQYALTRLTATSPGSITIYAISLRSL